ncbi:related to N-glycosylation protein EOS1 [Zygosaccharomyces bailii ISA1307]|uniref:ZYBA0S04-07910g1_1 n=1 Tax=Zygosaccharomyces bailii (strain CLIB 213 / ATCC 58445 / CBS 680 / BCRC 21525 / NBRC 1098 / NCYC 1416 / NRRL Y-2227) TaxID=1333698 RepID=A0A8J2T6J4_ZYGB2|nr:ZYBA0S04-07910g1_1 [Zygosaccharomyces bailii CLIB 213]CDH13707.1 related to N-glycosylation protein EOS1 [Zygosaccharomyces bailii ISA1307]
MRPYLSIKTLSLSHLTAKQHLLMAISRDVSLLPPLAYSLTSCRKAWQLIHGDIANVKLYGPRPLKETIASFVNESALEGDGTLLESLTTARASEYLLCSLWCMVSLYLSYSILDSLMVRWIVKYSILAAIVRMFAMSLIIITLELILLASLSPKGDYYLHTWVLISCVLTGAYIWQSYITSNLNYGVRMGEREAQGSQHNYLKFSKKRTIDLYNITVFCVVPVGLASFITMIGLLRNLVIQRLDVEQLARMLRPLAQEGKPSEW